VAVRHAPDHIHIAAVLVRQDTGRRFWPHHDYPKLRAAAQRIEQRLGLTVTAAADGTAAARPSRGEIEKARRAGWVPARVELRRAAQRAAVAADGVEGFVAHLRERGYLVELRRVLSGDLLGYKLARPGDVTAAGEAVFYSGSKLAPDLSLPRLRRRWAAGPGPAGGGSPAAVVAAARAALAAGSEDVDGIVAGTADLLVALGGQPSGERWGQRWAAAAERFDRAARSPYGAEVFPGPAGTALRRAARGLLAAGRRAGRDTVGGVALVVAVAGLLAEIAAWQDSRDRVHQGAAARAAAAAATQLVLDHPHPPRPRGTARGTARRNQRERSAAPRRGGSAAARSRQIGDPAMTLLPPPLPPASAASGPDTIPRSPRS